MNVPVLGQLDGRWAGQRLGTKNGASIGGYGCLITDITMMNLAFNPGDNRLVNNIDDIFTSLGGYVDGAGHRSPYLGCDLVDWNKIHELLPNCALVATANYPDGVPADTNRIKQHIAGGGLVILQVFWKGNHNLMHFVLGVGSSNSDILVNDPETGRQQWFSSKLFGSGSAANDIYSAHFFVDGVANNPAPMAPVPPAPAAASPSLANQPAPAQEEQVTQAQHDAAIAALNTQHQAEVKDLEKKLSDATELAQTQGATITSLTTELAASVPEYVHTYQGGSVVEVLTLEPVTVVDFADQHAPVELPANTIVEVEGTFTAAGAHYYRTKKSLDGGYYYGVPVASVSPYTPAPGALDTNSAKAALSTSQSIHAMGADGMNGWQRFLSKLSLFGGKKS